MAVMTSIRAKEKYPPHTYMLMAFMHEEHFVLQLELTKAVTAGKFLDISLRMVQVLTSHNSRGLSLNTTARYCLK